MTNGAMTNGAMTRSNSDLSGGDRLAAYLPGVLVEWLRASPTARHRAVDGTVVLADVAGFTALTERLASAGKVGAEETSDLLSDVFTDLLRIAHGHGGQLVKWCGDAILLLFRGEDHPTAATAAAWDMRASLRRAGRVSATAGPVRLRLSVGVHTGRLELHLVGTVHRELVVVGATAGQAARMQSRAGTGEIVLSRATARLLDPGTVDETGTLLHRPTAAQLHPPTAASPQRATAAQGPDGPRTSTDLGIPALGIPDLDPATLLPATLRELLAAGAVEGEHRRVAVAFVEFTGVAAVHRRHGRGGVWEALQDLVAVAQEACHRHAVTFLETDICPDGGRLLLAAGAPQSQAHDGERLLAVVRTILGHQGPLHLRAGANAGRVFADEFGPPEQRTYSVKGDVVNLAARVMQHARPGQLLATPAVLGTHGAAFACTPVPPFRVKGKSTPVTAVEIGEAHPAHGRPLTAGRPSTNRPLAGRTRELGHLRELLSAARAGHGAAVLVSGPPGIGKSRLVAEIEAEAPPARVLSVGCERSSSETPYALVEAVLRDLLQPAEPGRELADALVAAVSTHAPSLGPWLPLLGDVVGAQLPPTPEADALADEFRRARREESLVELVTALLPGPSLVVVDDAHLADEASTAVLGGLLRDVSDHPWLVLLTGTDDVASLDPSVERLVLDPLDATELAELLAEETRDLPLLPHVRRAVIERAAGNPLFLHALIPVAGTLETTEDLPESVEDVLAAEIDRLAPADRMLLRAAAAGGMRVDTELLDEALREALGEEVPPERWERLSRFVEPALDGSLRIRHALVRDVAYQGLSYRHRRLLHAALARALQRRPAPEAQADVLAHHCFHAQEYATAAHFARIAGERAASVFANAEAAALLSRALEAVRREPSPAPEEVARVAEACGDVRYRLGEFAAAATEYASARQASTGDPVARARLHLKTAQVVARTDGFSRALAWITRGRRAIAGLEDPEAMRQDARLLVQAALMRQMQGRYDETEHLCEAAVAVATRAGARAVLAQAMQLLDAADVARGRFDGEPWAERALAVWRERGNLAWEARAQNQLGIRAYFAGRWDDARAHYLGAVAAFERVGDQWNAAVAACNVGEILADQGRCAEADATTRPAAEVLRASGALSESAFALSVLGRTALRSGRIAEARTLLAASRDAYATAGEPGEVAATDVRVVECLLAEGRGGEAMARIDDLAAGADDPAIRVPLDRLRGYAWALQGRLEDARTAFASSRDAARARHADYEELLALDALTRLDALARTDGLDAEGDGVCDPDQVAYRIALGDRLGVVAVPALPLTSSGDVPVSLSGRS